MTPRERVIRVLLRVLANPYRYTRRNLKAHFGVSLDTIKSDIQEIRNAGLEFVQEEGKYYRCAILPESGFDELRYLQSLTEGEKGRIGTLLNQYLSEKEALYLNKKLGSLYDFQQLGLRALRRPALERIDRLEAARKQKLRAVLKNYRSNSNKIRDRRVEVFHVDPDLDTIQAFDVEERATRHFRLSRIQRVEITDLAWEFEGHHSLKPTDVFRIADIEQVLVQLRLDVQAYNALIEQFPKALSEIQPGAEPNTFDFQSKVNDKFFGLINFIMGNAGHVEVLGPPVLIKRIQEEATKILEKHGRN